MPSPLQPSINLAKAPGNQRFDDAVAPGPYQAAGDAALIVANIAGPQTLNLATPTDGAYLGQVVNVQVTLASAGLLTVNTAVPTPVAAGQVANIVATDDGAGGIAWVTLTVV